MTRALLDANPRILLGLVVRAVPQGPAGGVLQPDWADRARLGQIGATSSQSGRGHQVFREAHVFAIIKSGGRQVKVTPGAVIEVDRVQLAAGDKVTIDEVLFVGKDLSLIHISEPTRPY